VGEMLMGGGDDLFANDMIRGASLRGGMRFQFLIHDANITSALGIFNE
jgi:hypothetical protein